MIFEIYSINFYNFHHQFSIDAIIHITDCNKFDIKFIIYLLSKKKKLNYKLSILYKNKLHYIWDTIYKLESLI